MVDKDNSIPLPKELVDAHHHFLDTGNNDFQSFLGSLLPNEKYLPDEYYNDVVKPLSAAGVKLTGSVHVECMPDDGSKEVEWLEKLAKEGEEGGRTIRAIVASCDLTSKDIDSELEKVKKASGTNRVRGIRWILDCIGKFEPGTATHVATKRHDGIDYLRGSDGGYDGSAVPEFERGFKALAKHGLSFDLQCAPAQLLAAADLIKRHPDVPVVINHIGKPRTVLGTDVLEDGNTVNDNTELNAEELELWRKGMQAMAALPNVYVKISMLGYAIPGWIRTPDRTNKMKDLVLETIDMFTPKRCMMALNWWKSGPISDSDFLSSVGPDPVEFVQHMVSFLKEKNYSQEDQDRMFAGTAREFYKF